MKVRVHPWEDGTPRCVEFECPGCGDRHSLTVNPHKNGAGAGWDFNGDVERPTLMPSILARCGPILNPEHRVIAKGWNAEGMKICHSFVRDGRIEFLGDSTHELANQTVELPDVEPPEA